MIDKQERYKQLKEDYQNQLHSETLRKFEILNEAYKLGKKIKGIHYNYRVLSLDFEIPYTTCKRILSLRKANKITWSLIKSGKITSFKAAMVLHQKDVTYQDELIDLVIKQKLSTYDIKNLKDGSLHEVKQNRLRIARQKGFARADVAFMSFERYINSLNEMLLLDVDYLPKKKIPLLKRKIKSVSKNINSFLERLEK